MENEASQRIPPGLLFRSFLLVGGGYALSLVAFLFSIWLLSMLFFPDLHALFGDQEKLEAVMANTPEEFYTRPFFWTLLAANIPFNFVVGYAVVRLASFARFAHALFVAVTILISFLQQSLEQPSSIQWMFALMMAAYPIAIMAGAQLGISRMGSGVDKAEQVR